MKDGSFCPPTNCTVTVTTVMRSRLSSFQIRAESYQSRICQTVQYFYSVSPLNLGVPTACPIAFCQPFHSLPLSLPRPLLHSLQMCHLLALLFLLGYFTISYSQNVKTLKNILQSHLMQSSNHYIFQLVHAFLIEKKDKTLRPCID
ncbi:hypothetical protein ILYODFUR_036285 [Ilyodon furcidens]|uniref:Uncharacterized protein n=1 Tax=Ilyodon furcidens TaxID=33524 RepID=A0ABV0SU87_9TELE